MQVAERLSRPYPLVRMTAALLRNAKPDEYGMLSRPWNEKCVDLRVSKPSLPRALRGGEDARAPGHVDGRAEVGLAVGSVALEEEVLRAWSAHTTPTRPRASMARVGRRRSRTRSRSCATARGRPPPTRSRPEPSRRPSVRSRARRARRRQRARRPRGSSPPEPEPRALTHRHREPGRSRGAGSASALASVGRRYAACLGGEIELDAGIARDSRRHAGLAHA